MKPIVLLSGIVSFPQRMLLNEHTRNRLTILKAILHNEPVARTQLPTLTGLSVGTISSVTADLLRRELIVEERDESASRGRPRVLLSINAKGAVVAGARIEGVNALSVALVDLSGRLLHSARVPLARTASLPDMAAEVGRALRTAIAASGLAGKVVRAGIALPAIVNPRLGTVVFMTTFPQEVTPFAAIVSDAIGMPVTIENDMVVMARAEHWFGRAQALDTFTLIHFGFALGSARYVDGLPWSGATGITTELAHTKIDWSAVARPCYCGGRGCATAYSSIYGILQAAGRLGDGGFPQVEALSDRFAEFIDDAVAGDASALALLDEAGARLGQTIANHVNAADPGKVLVLLPDNRLHALIGIAFDRALVASVLPGMLATVHITFAVADGDRRWKGTAALALEQAYVDARPLS